MTVIKEHDHRVIIVLGTNIDHGANMDKAMELLCDVIGDIRYSRRMWTEPIGMASGIFLNMMVSGICKLSLQELKLKLKWIEVKCGRTAEEQEKGTVRMDMDILKYDERTEHIDDWSREYIKELIKDL